MIAAAFTKKTVAPVTEVWTRPTDWLALPDVPAQGLVGLCAVPPEGAYVAIKCRSSVAAGSNGAFIINWGDNTSTQVAENTTYYKTLNYADYGAETLTSRGYRQAIITVTNKTGQNLTQLQLLQHTGAPYATPPWLDIETNGTTALTALTIGGATVYQGMLERVKVHSLGNVTSLSSLFRNCRALQEVTLPSTTKITSMASMFQECISLLAVPAMDTSNVTSMSNLFSNCTRIKSVPTLNTAKVTAMNGMFQGCVSLESVQPSFTSNLCTTFANMFSGCYSLTAVGTFSDTSKVTTISAMFNECRSLKEAPAMNLPLVTTVASAFTNCFSLTSLPNYSFPKALTSAYNFINGARKIQDLSNLTFSSTIGRADGFASNAYSLKALPQLNLASSTNNATAFYSCYNLTSLPITGAKANLDCRYSSLSAAALNAVFNSLATIPSTQATKPIIYIMGNPGTATCDASIAASKNWVVNTTTA
jgi:hypothetical protein